MATPLSSSTPNADRKATSRTAVVWVTTKVCISIGCEEVRQASRRVDERHVDSALEITENTLHGIPMVPAWVFDEPTQNTHHISEVWTSSHCKVEELPYQLPVRHLLHIGCLFRGTG